MFLNSNNSVHTRSFEVESSAIVVIYFLRHHPKLKQVNTQCSEGDENVEDAILVYPPFAQDAVVFLCFTDCFNL